MKILLSKEEIHQIVANYFKNEHSLNVPQIIWNHEDCSAELTTSKKEVVVFGESKLSKDQIDYIVEEILRQNPSAKIQAIKEVRTHTGIGLKESKEYVDFYINHGKFLQTFV